MSHVRQVMTALVTGALLVSGVAPVSAAAALPAHEVPVGSATAIPLDGGGRVLFPVNAERTMPVRVDVGQSTPTDAERGATGGWPRILGDVVTVTGQDAAGHSVRSLPYQVTTPDAALKAAPAMATDVVPGVELSVPLAADEVAGHPPNDVALYARDGAGAPWSEVPSAYDPAAGTVTGQSDRLGQFAVMVAAAAPAAAAAGPTVVLDADDDVGRATWPDGVLRELDQNLKLTAQVQARLEQICQATVVTTRGADPFVARTLRAQVAANANPDLMVTLAFNALDPGTPWGVESDGGVRAWASSPADAAFAQRFLAAVPQYTGRPATQGVTAPDGLLPYSELDAVDVAYAHVEMLFLDHNFDHPVITNRFDLVVDAAVAALVGQLKAQGFGCDGGSVLSQRPPAEQLQQLRNLGYQNYQLYGADPVSFSSGNYVTDERMFTLPGVGDQAIDLNLTYNSQDSREGVFGIGWSFTYNIAYQEYLDGGALVRFDDGRSMVFEPGPGDAFVSPPGSNATLRRAGNGMVELTTNGSETYRFDVDAATGYGVLASTRDRQGNVLTLAWGAPVGAKQLRPLQRVVDEAGQTVTLTSTADGRVGSVTHPDGRVWSATYAGNRLASLTDARAVRRSYEYNGSGYLTRVTAGDGVTYVTNVYDGNGRVTSQTNATGDVRRFEYQDQRTVYTDAEGHRKTFVVNDKGQVTETIDALGGSAKTGYDTDYNPTSQTDENGRATRTEYDAQGRPLKVTDPTGAVSTMQYNAAGDLVRMDQPDGLGGLRTTTFEVNGDGRVTRTTFDDGSTQSATFDDHGDRTSVTDQNGHTTRFTLDARGNTVGSLDPLGAAASATFDAANRQLTLTDENGHTTSYAYDPADNLLTATDPLAHVTRYAYDVNNKRTSMTDALGRRTGYTYDANLNLVAVTHPDASVERFTLDGEYGVVSSVDGRGGEVRTTYDALLRPVVSIDENGRQWTTSYDAVGNPTALTDPKGARITLGYDALDRVVSRTDQNGNVWRTGYDAAGNRTSDSAPDGTSIRAEFDALGQLTAAVDEQGNRVTVGYDPAGNVLTRTDRRGNLTSSTYDALNRVLATTNPDGGLTRRAYDPAGNTLSVTDPRGGRVQTGYDAADRAVRNTDANGAVSSTEYDAAGNPVLSVDVLGQRWRMEYDAMNRLTAKVSPMGRTDRFRYDANGNLVATVKPDGVVNRRVYDGRDALVKVVDNAVDGMPASADRNVTTTYERDEVGSIVEMVDAKGARTRYDVDALGQVTRRTDPLGRTTSWSYTSVGTVGTKTDGNGSLTRYAYEPDRQLRSTLYADGTATTFGYDADNFRTSMTDSVGTTTWTRDWRGLETSSTDAKGSTVGHVFDLNGNVTELAYSRGFRSRRGYDPANRLVSVTDPAGTITYTRDALGRPQEIRHPNGTRSRFAFDADGNTTTIDHLTGKPNPGNGGPGDSLLRLDYTYTVDKLVAERTMVTRNGKDTGRPSDPGNNGPDVTTYTYDGLNRLVGSRIDNGQTSAYTFDAVGNRTAYSTTDDPQSPSPKDAADVAYSFDAADQLLTETRSSKNQSRIVQRGYDRNGNLLAQTSQRRNPQGKPVGQPQTTGYTYNQADELLSDGTSTWVRDGLGRALTRTEKNGSQAFVHDRQQVIEQVGKDVQTFVRNDIQGLLSQTVGNNPVTEVLLTDVISTVFGVAGSNGGSSKIATQTDFGELVGNQHPSSVFGFAGELQDVATSRVDFLARSYDPSVGRFLQRDRAGQDVEVPASLQPYLYAFDSPLTYTDYLGFFGFSSITNFVSEHKATIASIAVGIAVGVAVGACIAATAGICGAVALTGFAAAATVGATSAVAAGVTYRGLDGDPATRAFSLRGIATDAVIGGVTGGLLSKAGPLLRSGVNRVTATQTGQRIVGSRAAQAAAQAAARSRAAARAAALRAATAVRAAAARSSNVRSTASALRTRVVTRPSGRVTPGQFGSTVDDAAAQSGSLLGSGTRGPTGLGSRGAARYGSGSGPWTEGLVVEPGGAVGQLTGGSCVAACGEMLSGGSRSQAQLIGALGEWSNPQALAHELGEGWTGGYFASAGDAIAAASRGPMGATLQAGMGPGHMVVTSPIGNGRFLVRDPWYGGSTYEVGTDWISKYVSGGVFR
jgi:RHS repeat-associated protein